MSKGKTEQQLAKDAKFNVVQKRFMDQCYKEGWTYDLKTQRDVLHFIFLQLGSHPLHVFTQKLLRDCVREFRAMHPGKGAWNLSGSSDKRRLWAAQQELLHHHHCESSHGRDAVEDARRTPAADPSTAVSWEQVQEMAAATGSSKPMPHQHLYCQIWRQHVGSLQSEWGPKLTQSMQPIDEAFQQRYCCPCPPTEGFVHQVLQDLETNFSFLSTVNQVGRMSLSGSSTNEANSTLTVEREESTHANTSSTVQPVKEVVVLDLQASSSAAEDSSFGGDCGSVETQLSPTEAASAITTATITPAAGATTTPPATTGGETTITPIEMNNRQSTAETRPNFGREASSSDAGTSKSFIEKRVYAKFPGNSQWYWGIITKQQKIANGTWTYSVWYDDGDTADDLPYEDIITEEDYRAKWENIYNKPVPRRPLHLQEYKIDTDTGFVLANDVDRADEDFEQQQVLSLEQIHDRRCTHCSMCNSADCGECVSCRFNKGKSSSSKKKVCVRKMCNEIPVTQKAQPAPGFPYGWTYYFSDVSVRSMSSDEPSGLVLLSPSGGEFRSMEAAINRYRHQLQAIKALRRNFFHHIGQKAVGRSASASPGVEKPSALKVPLSTTMTNKRKDGQLSSSMEIGARVYAEWTNGFYYWGDITNKFTIQGNRKPFYSIQFDDGDFLEKAEDTERDGHRSIYTEAAYKRILGKDPPKRPSNLRPVKRTKTSYNPTDLFALRCKACHACQREDCGKCDTCTDHESDGGHRKQCCLQKMCSEIDRDMRKQPAPGLPTGWTYVTGEPDADIDTEISGLLIFSPGGEEYQSLPMALNSCRHLLPDVDAAELAFQAHIGANTKWNDTEHFLFQKRHYQEWIGYDGSKRCLFGVITECIRDKLDTNYRSYTITYEEKSWKNHLRSQDCFSKTPVSRRQELKEEWAYGGYVAYVNAFIRVPKSMLKLPKSSTPVRHWLIPDWRCEELFTNEDGKRLPRLTLYWKGFQLVFTVAPSSIPNSGYGVFVQVESMYDDHAELKMMSGELLDLGVYAPLLSTDRKDECVFLMKNFVHALKCEEWSFDPTVEGHIFDITKDGDGELHAAARSHIPPYVNECALKDCPTVHAEHDPDGAVHYLFGTLNRNLCLPCDGRAFEIFINYGKVYESVRLRKGYSFVPQGQQGKPTRLEDEAADYIEELSRFSEQDVVKCIRFLDGASSEFRNDGTVARGLAVSLLLFQQARLLHKSMDNSPFAEGFKGDISLCDKIISKLVGVLGDGEIFDMYLRLDYDSLINKVVKPFLDGVPANRVDAVLSKFLGSGDAE